jgi:hypothetical protein
VSSTDRPRDEAGQGGIEGLAFGFAIFVLGTLVVANAWAVVDAKTAAVGAAREATRAFVEAPESSDAPMRHAVRAAHEAMVGMGRDPERVSVVPEVVERRRCGRVTLRVEYAVPLLTVPVVGRYGRGFVAQGRHTELVEPFRSGLPDRGTCPAALQP